MYMKLKEHIKLNIKCVINKRLKASLVARDKKQCMSHKDWIDLTVEEKGQISKSDLYPMKTFKNIYGFSKNFVSDSFYQCVILPKLNSVNYNKFGMYDIRGYYEDKNYQELFLEGNIKTPKVVLRNVGGVLYNADFDPLTKSQALDLMNKYSALVFKTSCNSGHGTGVTMVEKCDYENEMEIREKDYIVQEILKQHSFLSNYNSSSVNIIRITTLNLDGEVTVLSGILRIGPPGAFCDLLERGGYIHGLSA